MNGVDPLIAGSSVLFVAPSAYPLGGMQVWLDCVLEGLPRFGWRTELALVSGRLHDVDAYLRQHPFDRVVSVAAPSGARQGRVNAVRDCVLSRLPDIVVGVNIADVYEGVATARLRGAHKVKSVASLHALQPDFIADFTRNRDVIDAVISTNSLARRLVGDCADFGTDRALYAPYGVEDVDVPGSDTPTSGVRRPLRLAYVGRIEETQKRVSDLVLILAAVRRRGLGVEAVIVGDGPDLPALRREISKHDLESCVRFTGALSAAAVSAEIYADCDALIVTSAWETGPIVAWEAMVRNVPLVSSKYLGSGAEGALVDGENCLLFEVGDIDGAVAKLERLNDSSLRSRLAAKGRELVHKRYTVEQSIAQWSARLADVLRLPQLPVSHAPSIPPSGRLDRLFGSRLGEAIRSWRGRGFAHVEPGGEWPHAYGEGAMSADTFWSLAQSLDTRAAMAERAPT